jgi:uncharacterized protein YcbX
VSFEKGFFSMPHLSGITVYPVKSLDGIELDEVAVLRCGALANDRRWRLIDAEGDVVNAKRNNRFHAIRAGFHLENSRSDLTTASAHGQNSVTLSLNKSFLSEELSVHSSETFPLVPGSDGPCEWLSEVLAEKVFLQERVDGGFPDDRDAAGPTVISTESLLEVASWFDLSLEESRNRFRMNLEVSNNESDQVAASQGHSSGNRQMFDMPFWEDGLACSVSMDALENPDSDYITDVAPVAPSPFWLGGIEFYARGTCRRCIVPTRDSLTGIVTKNFQEVFEARRSYLLPNNVVARNWRDYFCLGINTSIEKVAGSRLAIGDQLSRDRPVLKT